MTLLAMSTQSNYKLGEGFPHEGFLQKALLTHFAGWDVDQSGPVDLRCQEPDTGVYWVIEAKGETQNIGLDFHTGLGQLMSQMRKGPRANYVLAVPDTEAFVLLCRKIPSWVREALNLYWFLVDEEGEVTSIPPHVDIESYD